MFEVGVVGGTGYTGVELLRLLARHPGVHLRAITSRSEAGKPVTDLFPSLRGRLDLRFEDLALDVLAGLDLVFFATPNGVAMNFVPELLERGVRVRPQGPLQSYLFSSPPPMVKLSQDLS